MSVPSSSDPSPPAPDCAAAAPAVRGEAGQLGLLFGALYFIQGLGEPTDGLVAQPIRSLLESWHYWGLAGEWSAILISLAIGSTCMAASLIQLDFAARVCPPRAAGAVFALLMALSNAGLSLSVPVASYLYALGMAWWDARGSFDFLVLVGALTTAACWLLIPVLRRHWGPAGVTRG